MNSAIDNKIITIVDICTQIQDIDFTKLNLLEKIKFSINIKKWEKKLDKCIKSLMTITWDINYLNLISDTMTLISISKKDDYIYNSTANKYFYVEESDKSDDGINFKKLIFLDNEKNKVISIEKHYDNIKFIVFNFKTGRTFEYLSVNVLSKRQLELLERCKLAVIEGLEEYKNDVFHNQYYRFKKEKEN